MALFPGYLWCRMKLDYSPKDGLFTLAVPRVAGSPPDDMYMREYGLNYSAPASNANWSIFFTGSPYAAATFAECATPEAFKPLAPLVSEINLSRATESGAHIDFPEDEELAPYQKADLEYGLKRDRYLCADEPGLGKTPIAIAYANEMQAKRVLVVVPASIRHQWCARIQRFSTMGMSYQVANPLVYAITSGRNGVAEDAAWTVVSYDLARTEGILNALRKGHYDLGIFDEIHFAKTPGSRRSRALWGGGTDPLYHEALADCCERVVGLSGTPMPNRPREIYSLARHMNWQSVDWMSQERFEERFNPIEQRWVQRKDGDWVLINDEQSGRHAELQNRLRAHFMSRHLKREVLTQLKLPAYDLIRVEETAAVKAALRAESMLQIDPDSDLGNFKGEVLGHITTARRLMGEAIAPQCAEWMKMLIEGGESKLLLFYWFINNGTIVEKLLAPWLARHNKYILRVDGSTGDNKQALVQQFIDDPNAAVMMGNVLTLGTGTDGLQEVCNHALMMEPDWVPGNNIQCIDRLDRFGQLHTVQADIFVAPNSIAEKTLASSLRKARVTHNALDRRFTL
jgi:SNF2 family DNA or RNA helicase